MPRTTRNVTIAPQVRVAFCLTMCDGRVRPSDGSGLGSSGRVCAGLPGPEVRAVLALPASSARPATSALVMKIVGLILGCVSSGDGDHERAPARDVRVRVQIRGTDARACEFVD